MTRKQRQQHRNAGRQAVAPKPATAPQAAAHGLTPFDLAGLQAGGPPVTSMAMATRHDIDPGNYTAVERTAARESRPVAAMDWNLNRNATDALTFVQATGWPGFQTLALLAQLPEYRSMHETLADEAVRTWGKITAASTTADGSADRVARCTQRIEQLGIRALVRQLVIHDQAYGGGHLFARIADTQPDAPLLLKPTFVAPKSLQGFAAVEPTWVSPSDYNATHPTRPDFYKPRMWYLLGEQVHASRVHTVISRPVGDLLKAAYSFRGVSMTQLAMPYVDNWLRTRQAVSDTVKQFSVTNLATDMSQLLAPGGAQSLDARLQLFNLNRDNRNVGALDKDTEEVQQINTPLSGLDALQAQSQEQMAAVSHIPLVKLLGITPAGLNANSDGEIRVWYDYVAGYQAHNLTPVMLWVLQLIQLDEFGDIDPGLSWDWNPLFELTDLELADLREKNARTDREYYDMGVVSGEQIAARLDADPSSGYAEVLDAEDDPLAEARDLAAELMAGGPGVDDPDDLQVDAP